MSKQQHKIMTEAQFDALCEWLGGPEGCNFQSQIPGDIESITWTCDGTLKLTRHWMRAHEIDEAANIPELEERGGYATARCSSTSRMHPAIGFDQVDE